MQETPIYTSSNGDEWVLVRDAGERPLVEHRPNAASGGRPARFTIDEFLKPENAGPEHQALRKMLPLSVQNPRPEIEIRRVVAAQIPEGEDHVVVIHSLSGEHRIVLNISGMAEVSGRHAPAINDQTIVDTQDKAIEHARELAAAHGLRTVYVREDV